MEREPSPPRTKPIRPVVVSPNQANPGPKASPGGGGDEPVEAFRGSYQPIRGAPGARLRLAAARGLRARSPSRPRPRGPAVITPRPPGTTSARRRSLAAARRRGSPLPRRRRLRPGWRHRARRALYEKLARTGPDAERRARADLRSPTCCARLGMKPRAKRACRPPSVVTPTLGRRAWRLSSTFRLLARAGWQRASLGLPRR